MKAIVITLFNNKDSVEAADRCIASAKNYGIAVEKMAACDAEEINAIDVLQSNKLPTKNFYDVWSRTDKAMACFFSHYSAWSIAEATKQPLLILEHDAVFKSAVDLDKLKFNSILNIGRPSYGKFTEHDKVRKRLPDGSIQITEETRKKGVHPFFSNKSGYLKGAHAYIVTPDAAKKLISAAHSIAMPADLFISKQNFRDIQELYPWPVEVEDNFSTVQAHKGTLAKHSYNENYRIV